MRTKALLGLAALAASAATCVAQSNVYSLNIVGYVNVDITNGYNLITVPLKPTDGNFNITNTVILPEGAASDESLLLRWTGTRYDVDNVATWLDGEWFSASPVVLNPGEAFFLNSKVNGKITFVGEVMTGAIQNTLPTGYSAVGNKVPVAEAWPGQDVGHENDQILTWLPAQQRYDTANVWSYIAKVGNDPEYGWTTGGAFSGGPTLQPGQGVFYFNTGSAINWTQNFNPQ